MPPGTVWGSHPVLVPDNATQSQQRVASDEVFLQILKINYWFHLEAKSCKNLFFPRLKARPEVVVKKGRPGLVSTLCSSTWHRQTIRIFQGCFKIHRTVSNSRT